ncbi:MAG: glycosyltransferase [Acidobacteria bacterium]|nr:glycosyltransferase [Acidobacteriota bacterium]
MKPRILIISPVTPYPVHHGAGSAIYGYIRALRTEFDITFVGFCPTHLHAQAQAGLDVLCQRAYLFRLPEARHLDAFSPIPYLFSNLQSEPMHQLVDHLLKEEQFDLVEVEYLGMADYAEGARCPRIIRAHVQEWLHYYINFQQTSGIGTRMEHLFWSVDAVRHNRAALESFDWVLVTSEEERRRAREFVPAVKAEALPFILMDCEYYVPAPAPPRNKQLLFVGFLPHTPNTDALQYFIREEWPLIRRRDPEARLSVVGEGASNALRGLMYDYGVDYLGFVKDLRTIYADTRVYIAPVTSGGGIRTKIVEAMTAGIPVVCNSFAPAGLGLLPEQHVIVRDNPRESVDAILHLLNDDQDWLALRDRARGWVENCYGLQKAGPRIAQRYLQFLRQSQHQSHQKSRRQSGREAA